MTHQTRAGFVTVATLATAMLAFIAVAGGPVNAVQRSDDNRKPSLAFKATPPVGFTPLKVRVVVDVKGGANDYADFYCANAEWDWADGNISSSGEDCDPYQAGKSEIQRRFTGEHTFREAGDHEVTFRLKQKNRIVGFIKGTVRVRSGIYDDSDQ
jgi:hypothetical protein